MEKWQFFPDFSPLPLIFPLHHPRKRQKSVFVLFFSIFFSTMIIFEGHHTLRITSRIFKTLALSEKHQKPVPKLCAQRSKLLVFKHQRKRGSIFPQHKTASHRECRMAIAI
jgi:hypothetical protein